MTEEERSKLAEQAMDEERKREALREKEPELLQESTTITVRRERSRPVARPRFVPACPTVCTGYVLHVLYNRVPSGPRWRMRRER